MTTTGWMSPEPGSSAAPRGGFSLRDLVRVLFARCWFILAIALLVESGIAFGVFWLLSPTYQSKARLHVDLQSAALTSVRGTSTGFVSDLEKIGFFETVIQEIETPGLIEEVVRELNLEETRVIGRIEGIRHWLMDLKASVGDRLDIDLLKRRRNPFADSFGAVIDNLETNRLEGSAILEMVYEARDPLEARTTLDAVVRRYIDYRNAFIRDKALGSSGYLKKEVDRLRREIGRLENSWLSLTKSEGFSLLQDAVPPDALTLGNGSGDGRKVIGLFANQRVVEDMMLSVVNMQTELERLLSQHTETHPLVARLRTLIAAYTEAVNRAPAIAMQTQSLLRELASATQSYGELLAAYRNAVALESEEMRRLNIIKVVQEPTAPVAPISPKRSLALAAGLFLALLVGIGVAILAELSADAVHDPDDVRDKLGLPYLTSLKKV